MKLTRSQTHKIYLAYEKSRQEIMKNFTASSVAWRKNKKSIGNGCYTYICGYICKTNKPCKK